jgi:hypothetical protein
MPHYGKLAPPIEQLILNQLLSASFGPFFGRARLHVAHSKDENQFGEWV